ncbi:MAG: DUF4270 domain-containing protein [Bacteroidetes bacterium]|nr:DUF4270 domain-containing protein [Bacteroidota bacterium]
MSCLFFFFLQTCKEPGPLEIGLPSGSENQIQYSVSDTTTVFARTVQEEPLQSDEKLYSLSGSYNDPVFGLSFADFSTQFRLSTAGVNFGDGFVADSVVFNFTLKGYYGNTLGTHNIIISELDEDIYADSSYYSDRNFAFKPDSIGFTKLSLTSADADIRIPATSGFIAKFQANGSGGFADDAGFLAFLKGIRVFSLSGNNSILYFDLLSPTVKLTLYYHTSSSAASSYDFIINTACARVNHFSNDYSGTPVASSLADTSPSQQLLYIQSMAGVKAKLSFPYFDQWKNKNPLALAKAELSVTIDANSGSLQYPPPAKLFLASVKEDGTTQLLADVLEGEAYFGGQYNSSVRTYTFSITRYLQQKLNGDISDSGLYLFVASSNEASGSMNNASRGVMDGKKMKLTMVYSDL